MLFAVDTNPLIDWAHGEDDIPDCFELIKRRVPSISLIVPPTVLHELGYFARTNAKNLGKTSLRVLGLIRDEPLLRPINLVPVGHGIVEINALKIRQEGLIDEDEIHDSMILAEAGLLNCEVLLSSDRHLTGLDSTLLSKVMKKFGGSVPLGPLPSSDTKPIRRQSFSFQIGDGRPCPRDSKRELVYTKKPLEK